MNYPYQNAENQQSSNNTIAVSTTSVELTHAMSGALERTQFIVTNLSSTETVTIAKGTQSVISLQGIVLKPQASYFESTDGSFQCWAGAVQGISTGSHNISISETFILRGI